MPEIQNDASICCVNLSISKLQCSFTQSLHVIKGKAKTSPMEFLKRLSPCKSLFQISFS